MTIQASSAPSSTTGRPYADGALPDFDPTTRRRMYEQLVDTLADLHNVDPEAADLGDFGKPGN